jgi:hypothetical protein
MLICLHVNHCRFTLQLQSPSPSRQRLTCHCQAGIARLAIEIARLAGCVKRLDVVVMRLIYTLCRQHAMLCFEILFFYNSTFHTGRHAAARQPGRAGRGPGHSGDRGTVPVPVPLCA